MKSISIIFGGSKGIGLSINQTLKKRGDKIISLSRNLINNNDLQIDLSDLKKTEETIKKLKIKINKIDNIIFCQRSRANNLNDDFNVSIFSTIKILDLLKIRIKKGGSIVFISSISIKTIIHDQPLYYHITRSAIDQMMKYFAVDYGKNSIRCNSILPAKLIKPENKNFYNKKNNSVRKMIEKITPLGKMGSSQDVANLVEFLTSPKSKFITGNTFVVDGGLSLVSQEAIASNILKK